MNSKRWIILGSVALAAAGFAVDRIWSAAPAAAAAGTSAETSRGKRAVTATARNPRIASAADTAAPAVPLPDPSLAPLEQLLEAGAPRDMFTPSANMLQAYQKLLESSQIQQSTSGPQPGSPEAFAADHQLQGTFTGPGGLLAVIDGKLLRPGDQLGGYRLLRVSPYTAEFRRGRDRVVLNLPQSGIASPSNGP